MDFAVPAGHRVKLKENEKKEKYLCLNLAMELKKTVEHESDNYTNCDWCFWSGHLGIPPYKILGAIPKIYKGESQINGLEEKNINDYGIGFTEKWQKQCVKESWRKMTRQHSGL